ncbi:hypothetical protein Tco_0909069 [Tanacetum coccineum]|uniref:RNA-directed DNA polymerase, eukaryota, reverse transcriptase zinc-binding domain protein n=1 Tax=Tanacetum coccineum TaxID=301880 RepID=A0ABQ5CW66_9ASTR
MNPKRRPDFVNFRADVQHLQHSLPIIKASIDLLVDTVVGKLELQKSLRLIGKVQVGTAFVSKGDNEVPFEFKTEGGSLLDDELNRGEKDSWELTASDKIETQLWNKGITVSTMLYDIDKIAFILCAKIDITAMSTKVVGIEIKASAIADFVLVKSFLLNGGDQNGKKPIWIKWCKVLASKEKGGLGVPSLYALNRALLFKWVWRFYTQWFSLWAKVIRGMHGEDGKLCKNIKQSHSSVWLDIVRETVILKNKGTDLCGFIHKKMGNGIDTSFWNDVWKGDTAFKFLYPIIYALESCKNIMVAEKMSHETLVFSLRRDPWGGIEQEQFGQLLANVEGTVLANSCDIWVWSKEGSGDFSVASARRTIDDRWLPIQPRLDGLVLCPSKLMFMLGKHASSELDKRVSEPSMAADDIK